VAVLEDAKEFLGGLDDRIGPFLVETCAVVDPAPRHGDREHPRSLRRAHVEGRVADVGRPGGICSEPLGAEEERLRVGLVAFGLVAADDRLEEVAERDVGECELDGRTALRRDDTEPASLLVEANEHVLHPGARLELVVERLVVRAVDVDEPLDVLRRERRHLGLETGAADRLQQLLVRVVAPQHLARCVPHRGENDRARVDDGTVEVEEDRLEAHAPIVSAASRVTRLSAVTEPSDFRFLVVPHTHWDREWYLPFEQFRLRLGTVVDGVLDTLERDESFTSFTLDGQAILLEDYLEVRPDHEGRLRALLRAGRLEVGPSYVLPDEILVGGEALVRNLLLGRRVCRRFGIEPSGAGYLPDSFGHPAQLPQILAGFGIRTFLFSRGLGDEIEEVGVLFRWRAGPAEVVACQMLPHYDNFARLTSHDDAEQRVRAIVGSFGEAVLHAGGDAIVLANGSDHLPIEPELPELLAALQRTLGAEFRIGRYDEYAPGAEGLPVHEGELVGSRLQNVLRGVNSARIYLKQANERAERRVLSVETAASLRTLRGDAPYPADDLRLAWRDLLRNHPHDSICGCSCDEVHRDMLVRYEQLDRTLDYVEREALGVGGALVNTLPFRRRREVDGDVYELDGFSAGRPEPIVSRETRSRPEAIADLLVFEDERDVGDLYTFCPDGKVQTATLVGTRRSGSALVLEHELPGIAIETTIRQVKALPDRYELTSVVENESEDHRLRALVRSGSGVDEVRAESQFAVVRRPLAPPPPRGAWVEPPVRTAHTLGAVALGDLVLLTRGLPEYEASPEGLRLTLLRCVGTISRPSGLATRPVGAGPVIATPDGQCRGRHVFEYALRFDGGELSNAGLLRASQDYRTDFLRGDPFECSLALGGDVVFSCLKRAEDGTGFVLRVFNPNPEPESLTLSLGARRIRLDEEQDAAGGLELAPGEIVSFLIGD
jgi:Glycosyl hydrolases family 38 N-terminal domain/Alpha mannosidase middle domain/Glycosyl hydrolases family 38 C-terminal beta sandwich domain